MTENFGYSGIGLKGDQVRRGFESRLHSNMVLMLASMSVADVTSAV